MPRGRGGTARRGEKCVNQFREVCFHQRGQSKRKHPKGATSNFNTGRKRENRALQTPRETKEKERYRDMGNENQKEPVNGHEPEGYITKEEVAKRLKKTVRTVENWMRKGILPFVKAGRSVLFKWADVEAHLHEHFRVCRRTITK